MTGPIAMPPARFEGPGRTVRAEPGTMRRVQVSEVLTLEGVERRRWHLWIVAGIFLVVVSATVVIALSGDESLQDFLPEAPAIRWSFLALSVAFLLYVADQERRFRALTVRLMDQQVLAASLEARISDLTTLSRVGRVVNSVLTLDEVLTVILDAAFELTGATTGSVMLREDDVLVVRVSEGAHAAPIGAATTLGDGVAGAVATLREAVLVDGRLDASKLPGIQPRSRDDGCAVVSPLVTADEVLGVLALERTTEQEPFTELELRSLSLFAEHAATAVANAQRFEHERRTAARLADVIEMRSEFVATLVHDLKSPLTSIMGFASMLRRRWERLEDAQRGNAVEAIEGQAERLYQMVEEILRTASLEAGAELSHDPVDLADLLRELAEAAVAATQAEEAGPRRVHLRGLEPGTVVTGDAEALRHVFSNLLDNALKYSPAGSPVEIELTPHAGEIRVCIRDHGAGIPPEEQAHVFERFRQSGSQPRGGVGLGLYIVHTLVTAHGGRVWVDSPPGSGAAFTVALPVRPDGVTIPDTDAVGSSS